MTEIAYSDCVQKCFFTYNMFELFLRDYSSHSAHLNTFIQPFFIIFKCDAPH